MKYCPPHILVRLYQYLNKPHFTEQSMSFPIFIHILPIHSLICFFHFSAFIQTKLVSGWTSPFNLQKSCHNGARTPCWHCPISAGSNKKRNFNRYEQTLSASGGTILEELLCLHLPKPCSPDDLNRP